MSETHLVAIVSDVHFDGHHEGAWNAFREWHAEHKPDRTIAVGDLIDLGMVSRYEQGADEPVFALDQIRMAVQELNSLNEECGKLQYVTGNHEERWEKALFGTKAQALRGALGLRLSDQYYAQGLDPSIKFRPYVEIGGPECRTLIIHGHRQAGRYGVRNVASSLLTRYPGHNTVVGHHHRAQVMYRTYRDASREKTVWAVANPHLSGEHDYVQFPDWQRGFTVIEYYGRSRLRDCVKSTPYLVVMDEKGRFSWRGKVYG